MYQSVFISDLHLGSKHCQAEPLLEFLKNVRCKNLYLVGDIIDGWRLQKKWYWPKAHTDVLRQIVRMANKGVNVYYISGNHDEFLRTIFKKKADFGNITLCHRMDYQAINGKKLLVIHGDLFDYLMRSKFGRTIMSLGDFAYDTLAYLSWVIGHTRRFLGLKPWSLTKYLKHRAKAASSFVGSYEKEMSSYCKRKKYDGIICGHIHTPDIREIDGVLYMNDGDFVENCSALVETLDGEFKIVYNLPK